MNKEKINLVWLKRDLRLHDNEAISRAIKNGKRFLIFYAFEKILINDPHYNSRHWNFIKQSLVDLNSELKEHQSKILSVASDVIGLCNQIQNFYTIETIYSHQETGILTTYTRDKEFKRYCRNNNIDWKENVNNGVQRGLKHRENWFDEWEIFMNKKIEVFNPLDNQLLNIDDILTLENISNPAVLETSTNEKFQRGGRSLGYRYLNSFFKERHKDYMFNISKPNSSRTSCSRLSPYLAWGNLSVREVFQMGRREKTKKNTKHIGAFLSRLRWQAHFIQKFEMEHVMEKASINKGYHKLKKSISKKYQDAWINGQTGFPLVDACMRCLQETGYLNFRMRALTVSFFTHILWQPWQDATTHLSQMFLDFEPGIHFPQLQMQAGETGINNLRIYNPIKNGKEHDEDAIFIKKWVPELKNISDTWIHEPWKMELSTQRTTKCIIGRNYPAPIVDHTISIKLTSN